MTKLLTKNTRYLLAILPPILLICSILFFFLLRMQVHHLQKEQLFLKQRDVLSRFANNELDSAYNIKREFDIQPVKISLPAPMNIISDTTMENPQYEESKSGVYRKLTTFIKRNDQTYKVTTYVSTEETKHLFMMVFGIQAFIYLMLFITIIVVNRKLSTVLWKPFYNTIAGLKLYDIRKNKEISFVKTGISEFNELNNVSSQLIERNRQAYQSQKQFVENASHEIQTPLAIIRSKVELMMEQPDINEQTATLASEISEANDRLTRLNKILLLLTKIDNNQFIEQTDIDLSALTEKLLNNFQHQYLDDFPELKKNIEPHIYLLANQTLIEILINNLLKNAIVHNLPGGYLKLDIENNRLVIANTGPMPGVSPALLFERFRKGNDNLKHSYGLGLALVKHICDMYHYQISYTCHDQIHTLEMRFR